MEENKLKLLMGKCKPGEYPLWENTLEISHMGLRHLLYMEIFLKGSYSYDMGPHKRLLFLGEFSIIVPKNYLMECNTN